MGGLKHRLIVERDIGSTGFPHLSDERGFTGTVSTEEDISATSLGVEGRILQQESGGVSESESVDLAEILTFLLLFFIIGFLRE